MFENTRWNQQMGPNLKGQSQWLFDNYQRFDVAIVMTYLYATATLSIPILFGRLPVVFQPTAHTEPALRANIFEYLFRMVDSFLFFTPEEQTIVENRFRRPANGLVAGIGIETRPSVADWEVLREKLDLSNPYIVYVGRIDPMKGVRELTGFFSEMARLRPDRNIDLVLVGEQVAEIEIDSSIIRFTGYLEPDEKHAVIRNSMALVQPSYFESFSIVLCEAWVQERPVLVQGKCSVLRGQVERSQGGIPFEGFAEFEQSIEMLMNPMIAENLGRNGRAYVENEYQWPVVIGRVEEAIELAKRTFKMRYE
jgi:glycosyltransferase involved in cell wall biosynthesis